MELEKNWRKIKRDGLDRFKNQNTQPTKLYEVFNNHTVVTESWHPVIASKKLKKNRTHSFVIGSQRFVIFRDNEGKLSAMDAFCPHMGADLGNGKVINNRLQCYFHQWEMNSQGELTHVPCKKHPPKVKLQTYPVEEKYGFIWIYSGPQAPYPVPHSPGLENDEVSGFFLARPRLFVHHHILMVSAVDLQHFRAVHKLDINFQFDAEETAPDQFQWNVFGTLPNKGFRGKLARLILGSQFEYTAQFTGGNIVSINYGNFPRWRGKPNSFRLPSVNILWGCVPLKEGVSDVYIFLVQKKAKSLFGRIKNLGNFILSILVLNLLRDDDVKAFPHMRFDPKTLVEQDSSAHMLIQMLDKVKKSSWSFEN